MTRRNREVELTRPAASRNETLEIPRLTSEHPENSGVVHDGEITRHHAPKREKSEKSEDHHKGHDKI